jgi:hypothetical protein
MQILLTEHWQLQESVTRRYQDCDDPRSQANILNREIERAPRYHGRFALYAEKTTINQSTQQVHVKKLLEKYQTQRFAVVFQKKKKKTCHWNLS